MMLAMPEGMVRAQEAGLVSCVPATGMVGQQVDVVIKGRFTNFQQQAVTVDFGSDIQVERIDIRDFESLVVRIRIASNAANGPVNIRVRAGVEEYVLNNGFTVIASGGQLMAVLEVFPMQTVRMSDFEINNITGSPIIFNVIIYNDNKTRDLTAKLTLKGDRYGLVGYSQKKINNFQPSSVLRFTNREFDNYELNTRNNSLMQLIAKTNILPADAYDYILDLFDERGVKVGGAEASQVIVNLSTRPELIMPGGLFGQPQSIISNQNPQFQWFSQASKFDFALYPVLPNQSSQEEVLLNRPILMKEGLVTNSMVYPSSAEVLIDGQLYAWQVKARYNTTKGEDVLMSDVFWFKYSKNQNQDIVTESIRISPSYCEVPTGLKVQFSLEAIANTGARRLDLTGRDRNQVQMRLVPEGKGNIDANGIFTAGSFPGPVALVVEFAGITEYATIMVKDRNDKSLPTPGVLDKLLGLPPDKADSALSPNGSRLDTLGTQKSSDDRKVPSSDEKQQSRPKQYSNEGSTNGSSNKPASGGSNTPELKEEKNKGTDASNNTTSSSKKAEQKEQTPKGGENSNNPSGDKTPIKPKSGTKSRPKSATSSGNSNTSNLIGNSPSNE